MQMSLLHISDLHRDPANELSNDALLGSLEADRRRYGQDEPAIPLPTVAVVTGDVVYGVKHDRPDFEKELTRQSDQAYDFLVRLTDRFFDGDRNRIVLLPGNHDVSYPATMQSLSEISVDPTNRTTNELVRKLWISDSGIRWNWNTLSFWRIDNPDQYLARLDGFRRLYDLFYVGFGRRPYSRLPEEQYDIFDFPDKNITIVAMSSCFHNDPLRRQGIIHPRCVAQASQAVRTSSYEGRLLLAAWHHNTSGGPQTADYMDPDILQVLIDQGFSIGLHGHQHKPRLLDERFALGGKRKISVIGASTLCAGQNALPTGHRRGYNILQIDTESNKAFLHLRSMWNDDFALPVWGPGYDSQSGASFIEFDIQKPHMPIGGIPAANAMLAAAEEDIRNRRFHDALSKLQPLSANPLARPLLLAVLVELRRNDDIVKTFMPPENNAEVVHIANAARESGNQSALRQLLSLPGIMSSSDPVIRDIRERFTPRQES